MGGPVLIPLRVGRLFGRELEHEAEEYFIVLIPLRVGRLFGLPSTTASCSANPSLNPS